MCHVTKVGLDPIVVLFGFQSTGAAGVATLPGSNADLTLLFVSSFTFPLRAV